MDIFAHTLLCVALHFNYIDVVFSTQTDYIKNVAGLWLVKSSAPWEVIWQLHSQSTRMPALFMNADKPHTKKDPAHSLPLLGGNGKESIAQNQYKYKTFIFLCRFPHTSTVKKKRRYNKWQ